MIDKTKLAELRKRYNEIGASGLFPELLDTISTLLDENEKLMRVKEALEGMVEQFGFHRVHDGIVHDEKMAIIEAQSALAAFEGKE